MTIKISDVTCRLFIGFGGSGGKTLVQLAQMFAHDREWARRSEAEAYFLLIDTDVGDIEKHEKEIRRILTEVGAHAWVKSIGLAEGINDFARVVDQRIRLPLDESKRREYLTRFHDTWWFNETIDGRPWNGCKLPQPPTAGAGQCSAIAYYLAWVAMSGANSPLGETVDSLCAEMSERVSKQHGTTRYSVDMYVVAGLAGGTGRGSWAITSMKIAEQLNSRGKVVRPTGIFFDWSCFKDVAHGTKGQRAKMIVNSLTGISMITGWVQNDALFGKRSHLQWPSFMDPLNEQRDVFAMKRLLDPGCETTQMGCTPARQAWIVFGESAAGHLADKEHYAIAAAALYGRNVRSEVNSTLSNTVQSLGSVGASIFRVDVHHIQDYLKQELLKNVVDSFLVQQPDEKVQSIAQAIAKPLLTLQQGPQTEMQFATRLDEKAQREVKSKITTLFERTQGNPAKVNDCDNEELLKHIKEILDLSGKAALLETHLASAVSEALAAASARWTSKSPASGDQLILNYLRHVLQHGFPEGAHPEIGNVHCKSVATAIAVVTRLKTELKSISAGLRPDATIAANDLTTAKDIAAAISKMREGFLWWKRTLRPEECIKAKELVTNALKKLVLKKHEDKMNEWLDRTIIKALERWDGNLQLAHSAAKKFKGRLKVSTDQATSEDQLFLVGKDFTRYRERNEATTGVKATQLLQPVLELEGKNRKEEWLEKLHNAVANARFDEALRKAQGSVFEGAYTDAAAHSGARRTVELERSVEEHWNKLKENITVPLEFMRAEFSITSVLKDQYQEWIYQLDRAQSDEKAFENLRSSFEEEMGFKPEKDDFGYKQMNGPDVLERVAMRIGQKCCAQYINSRSWKETPDTLVFLPTDDALAKNQDGVTKLVAKLNRRAEDNGSPVKFHGELATDQDKIDARGNPFQILAVTFEGFQSNGESVVSYDVERKEGEIVPPDLDHVTSLNYWRDNSEREVQLLLDASELENGKSWFSPPLESTIGIGYEIPAFVRDETLRKCRWRPWDMDKDRRREAARRAKEYLIEDAMIYALIAPGRAFPDKISVGGELRNRDIVTAGVKSRNGEFVHWELPLLTWDVSRSAKGIVDGVRFRFARKAFANNNEQWELSGVYVDPATSFESILEMYLQLKTEDGARILKAIHTEAAHYFKCVLDLERRAIEPEDVVELFREVKRRLENELTMHMKDLPGFKTKLEPRIARLLERARSLENMTTEALYKHFRGA